MDHAVRKPALILNGHGMGDPDRIAEQIGMEVAFRHIDELSIEILADGTRIRETPHGRDLREFGVVQVASYPRPTAMLINSVGDYLRVHRVPSINVSGIGAPTKLFKYTRLAHRRLRVPATVHWPSHSLPDAFPELAQRLDLPFVLKTASGGTGRFTSLITDAKTFSDRVADPGHARAGFLAQELVAPGDLYSILVLGGEVSLVLTHHDNGDTDIYRGPDWDAATLTAPADLEPEGHEAARRAAEVLEYDVAAVNLARHWTTGEWVVLDVNATPPLAQGRYAKHRIDAYRRYLTTRLTPSEPARSDFA